LFQYICHPDCFLKGYQKWDEHTIALTHKIASLLSKYDCYVELSGSGSRSRSCFEYNGECVPPYPFGPFFKILSQYPLKFVLGADAHAPEQLNDFGTQFIKDMAKKLNVTEATIRRQRFTFREKAKQAKFYLAMYELVFEDEPITTEQIIPIHNNAIYVDDRYLITEDEKQHIVETFFSSIQPLVLKSFSPKEKKKVVILGKIAEQFEYGKKYSEQEVNEILKPIYADYMTIRRYLIMYGFMERTRDGRQYWLTN